MLGEPRKLLQNPPCSNSCYEAHITELLGCNLKMKEKKPELFVLKKGGRNG